MSDFEAERDLRIAQLLDEARAEWRARGVLDSAAWQARYPDLADELPDLLDTLRDLDTAADDWKQAGADMPTRTVAGAPPPASTTEGLPAQIGRYRVLGRLGAGGMGTVYKAEDPQLHRVVAVKVPRFDTPLQDRAQAVQRFLREGRAAARIRHPHVCPIYDVGEQDGWPYVVMACVEGPSLAERLRDGRFDDPRTAVALARQAAEALAAVHAHGIVHRDLKPGNILLDADGRAVLTDFGLAQPADAEHLTVTGALVGTPAYMAPEQASGETARVGPATDQYSLGVVLYQMLTGRIPFEGSMLSVLARVRSDAPPPPSLFRPDLDPALEAVVLQAMARRPEDRFPDAAAFAEALRRWTDGVPTADAPPNADAAVKPGPAVVRVTLPDGSPVTVSIAGGAAAPGKVAVTLREDKGAKGKRRRRLTVTITFALLLGLGVASMPLLMLPSSGPGELVNIDPGHDDTKSEKDKGPDLLPGPPRVRNPRVHITYDVETGGATEKAELPFVVGVLADLSGPRAASLPLLKDRKFVSIDRDSFDEVLERAAPRLVLKVANRIGGGSPTLEVELAFERMADFEPMEIVQRVDALRTLLESRKFALPPNPANPARVAEIDAKLSAQLSEIMHQPEFQRLEATWRGLFYLAASTETGDALKIRVLNVAKAELAKDAARALDYDETALFKKVYEEEFGQLGGEPYGLLVGDYEFGRAPADVSLLQSIADVAAHAHAPFVAAAAPELFGVKRFTELPPARDLATPFAGGDYAAWRAFRESESSRYVGLTLPRVLTRLPYGVEYRPVEGFDFEEDTSNGNRDAFVWMSAAWAFATRVTDAQAKYGWPARIQGWDEGGKVEGVPVYAFPAAEDEPRAKSYTEIFVGGRRADELSNLGFLPLLHRPGQEDPAFMGSQSCQKVKAGLEPNAAASAELGARLDALLCASRFVQVLQVRARDRIGTFEERKDCERFLNDWLVGYVLPNPDSAPSEEHAKRPLADARAEVRENRGKPGWYEMVVQIRPYYQFDPPPTAPVRLTAEVPRR